MQAVWLDWLRGNAVTQLDGPERLDRALDRIVELDRGMNPITGGLYEGAGLDGGHQQDHKNNPELSAAKENMMFENQYENRIKGATSGEESLPASVIVLLRRCVMTRLRHMN